MKKVISILLLSVFLLTLAGCDPYAMFNRYPDDKSTVWYCKEIDFEIQYAPNEYGNLAPLASALVWEGKTYMVICTFHAGCFYILLDGEAAPATENGDLLSGRWRYQGDNLIFEISEDNIFDNAFETLVFAPVSRNAE